MKPEDKLEFDVYFLDYKSADFNSLVQDIRYPDCLDIKNKKVGVLVGSRGIRNLDAIVERTVGNLRQQAAEPYVIPSMGSHGGATVGGQISLLAKYGVTPERMGAAVVLSPEVIFLGKVFQQRPVVVNAIVKDMDFLVGINKIKPHPRFSGTYESGILKLLSVGLGYCEGAENFHRTMKDFGFEETLVRTSKLVLSSFPFLFFLGVVEDRIGNTLLVECIRPDEIYEKEKKLLAFARENLPSIPVPNIDVIIIDEIGKNYSGVGIDTSVVGGLKGKAKIAARIYARNLSHESDGNAVGMGLVDFISGKFCRAIDFGKTYRNALSSMELDSVKMPLWFESDKEVLEYAATSVGKKRVNDLRMVWIRNTSDLSQICVTPNIAGHELAGYEYLDKRQVELDDKGNMVT
jgi:hypothetical protein